MGDWAAVLALLVLAPAPAPTITWTEAFAGVRDTVVFLTRDGALVRAPFNLATSETLWVPARDQHVVRMRASADGTRLAWLARQADADPTMLWCSSATGPRPLARYHALQPHWLEVQHLEPDFPSIDDRGARGARLIQPGVRQLRYSVNAFEWLADQRSLAFGCDGGIAEVPVDGGTGTRTSGLFPIELERLEPSPMLLVDALAPDSTRTATEWGQSRDLAARPLAAVKDASPDQYDVPHYFDWSPPTSGAIRASYLLCPVDGRWRACTVAGKAANLVWTANRTAVWWATGSSIHTVSTREPKRKDVGDVVAHIRWLGRDEQRDELLWVTNAGLWRAPADRVHEATAVLRTTAPVQTVLESRTSNRIGLVTDDSLYVVAPGTGTTSRFQRGRIEPIQLIDGPEGQAFVVARPAADGHARLVHANAATGRLDEIATPAVRFATVHAVGGGAWILLHESSARPPASLRAYDVRGKRWVTVENPGITAWEPLGRTRSAHIHGSSPLGP